MTSTLSLRERPILQPIGTLIWLSLLAPPSAQTAPRASTVRTDALTCTAREVSRTRLLVEGGRELYVEPVVVEVAGTDVLVAGRPSYLFRARQRGDTADLESTDVVFGAVITGEGTARTVAGPDVNHGKVAAVAATALGPGRWRVIFAESDSISADASDVVPAYWHGIYDGAHWSDIQRLPQPPAVSLQYFNRSRVIQRGDTIVWAGLVQTGRISQGVIVFERIRGVWSHVMPTTPFASSVQLIHTPKHGFILGVFRHQLQDFHLPGAIEDPEQKSAVRLYSRPSGWKEQRMISLPVQPAISRVGLDASGEAITVSTITRGSHATTLSLHLHTVSAPTLNGDERRSVVDSGATPHFAPVVMPWGNVLWVSQHALATADSTDQGELHLINASDNASSVIWRSPNPYLGPFSATAYSASDVMIVGPELDRAHELLVSLIIRVRVECVPANKRP